MNNLPTELSPAIIKQVDESDLCSCTLVSKSFYLATIPILWGSYTEISSAEEFRLKFFHGLENTQHPMAMYLRKLVLRYEWDDTAFLRLLPHLRHLETLTIGYMNKFVNNTFQQLPAYCPNLKALSVNGLTLTPEIMVAIGQHWHQLEELDLQYCTSTMTRPFAPLIQHGYCSLKKLKIDTGYLQLHWHQDMWMDVIQFTQLTHLACIIDSEDMVLRLVTTLSVSATSATTTLVWPQLTHLSIHFLHGIGDTQLIPMIQSHPRLLSLSLQESATMTDATLDAMATYLPVLTWLYLGRTKRLTSAGLRRLVVAQGCPHLTFVDLYDCFVSSAFFPEAGKDCLSIHELDQHGNLLVGYFDQDTLNTIRLSRLPSTDT